MGEESGEKDVATLVGRLGGEVAALVSKEMELARVELGRELSKGVKATASLSGAAVSALVGLLFVSAAAARALAEVLPDALALLIVGTAYLAISGVLVSVGRRRVADVDPVPHQTLETIKENAQWAKTAKRS